MPSGTPVSRHCIVVLKDGTAVVDWGNSCYQDLVTGQLVACSESDISRMAHNEDLNELRHAGYLEKFDDAQVYLFNLPESGQPPLE
jgi:hypothetical protein